MTYAAKTRENQIAIALGRCAASVKQAGREHWQFALVNGKPLNVSARLLEDWLLLDAPLTGGIPRRDWWDLLKLNACLQGLTKFVVMPDGPTNFSLSMTPDCGAQRQTEVCRTSQSVHLRADIPLSEDADSESDCASQLDGALTTRLFETCTGLKAAYRSFRAEKTTETPMPASNVNSEGPAQNRVEELRRLCGDTGWPFIERSAGKLMIDLDVRSGFYQAAVKQRDNGAEVVVEIVRSDALGETSRQALSLLLLGMGSLVKLARPSVEEQENQVAVRFEAGFITMPTAVELAHAFASLSVACAVSGREARALQDEGIARDYLAMRGEGQGAQASLPASS